LGKNVDAGTQESKERPVNVKPMVTQKHQNSTRAMTRHSIKLKNGMRQPYLPCQLK
jgi:hypothetical protein